MDGREIFALTLHRSRTPKRAAIPHVDDGTCGGCKGRPLVGVERVGGRAAVKRASSRCATEADRAAGVVFVLTQQIFDSNRGLEGEEMKNWASSRHVIGGMAWRDEALLTIPAL